MEAWYAALYVIAEDPRPMYWRLFSGAAFWWMPDRAELRPDGFARQPFAYGEIASVTLLDAIRLGDHATSLR